MMFKKLAQKLSAEREVVVATNPIKSNVFLNKLSQNAVDLYERQSDIKKFTKLVLSDPENESHNSLVEALYSNGIIDPDYDEKLLELSDNKRFLKDLGLL